MFSYIEEKGLFTFYKEQEKLEQQIQNRNFLKATYNTKLSLSKLKKNNNHQLQDKKKELKLAKLSNTNTKKNSQTSIRNKFKISNSNYKKDKSYNCIQQQNELILKPKQIKVNILTQQQKGLSNSIWSPQHKYSYSQYLKRRKIINLTTFNSQAQQNTKIWKNNSIKKKFIIQTNQKINRQRSQFPSILQSQILKNIDLNLLNRDKKQIEKMTKLKDNKLNIKRSCYLHNKTKRDNIKGESLVKTLVLNDNLKNSKLSFNSYNELVKLYEERQKKMQRKSSTFLITIMKNNDIFTNKI